MVGKFAGDGGWQLRFWSIWIGQSLSLTGSALTQFVLVWWITSSTNSSSAVAIAGFMSLLPQALFAPIGGVLADRFSRRVIMILADTIAALCVMVLIVLFSSNSVRLWHVYALIFARAIMQAFQLPASAATTPTLVPDNWLQRVAGLNQLIVGLMSVAAAPLGALALAFIPIGSTLLIDVVTAVCGITPLLVFSIPKLHVRPTKTATMLGDFFEGVSYVLRWPGMKRLIAVLCLVVFVVMPVFSLMPLLITQHFHGGVNKVAMMEGLAGLGMICGGSLMSIWGGVGKRIVMLLVMFALACATPALGALVPSTLFWVAVVGYFISGLCYAIGNVPMVAMIQSSVPNRMLGRVSSLITTMTGYAGPLGMLVMGALGEWAGIRVVFVVGGFCAASCCVVALLSKPLLQIEEVVPAIERS